MNQFNDPLTPPRGPKTEQNGSGWGIVLLALLPILCCGLPLIVVVLATASALAKGLIVGAVVAFVGIVVTLVVRRRMRAKAACCYPADFTQPSTTYRDLHRRL